jgi:DNA-binding HxlR family transcriptional regulator
MRKPRKDIDNYLLDALFKVDELSYSNLKSTIEGERYLNYTQKGKKLHDETFNSHLKRLEANKLLDRHTCRSRNNGRTCYSLTKTGRLEREMNLNENIAAYYLIIFTQLYNFNHKINGLSVRDILEKREVIRNRINRTDNSNKEKNRSIKDILNSSRIDKIRYLWFLVDDKITKKLIDDSFSVLEKRKMIEVLGICNGERRYTIPDDLYGLLLYCLSIKEDILLILEEWWKYNRSPSVEAKKWLEFFDPPSEVQIMIANYGKERQRFPHNKTRKWEKAVELKKQTDLALNRYKDKMEDMQSKFKKTIKKYDFPLLAKYIQITTNPFILKDIQEYIENFDSV